MMRINLFLLFLLCLAGKTPAQDLKIKHDTAFVDDQPCVYVDNSDGNNISIRTFDGKEIVFIKFIRNSRYAALYNKITFPEQEIQFTSKSYIYSAKLLLKKMIADKTLNNCQLDPSKVKAFAMKLDEYVEY